MANSKIPSVQITDTFNTQRGRFNQLVDSVGDVSTLTTTATDITNAIKEHDAELGTISAGAMGTTASTVSTAIAELDGRLDSINTVELLSPRMSLSDGSAVNTVAGKLEVSDSADFKDNLSVQGNLAVGGNTTMSGTLTVDGEVTFKAGANSNINLGDANTDNVVFNADVNSNIIPNTDDTYDLGSSSQEWRHVYVDGTVNADNVAADSATVGTLTVTGDTTLNNTITVQDSAYITGNLDLGSNLDVAGNVNVTGTVVSEGALTVEDSAYITGNLDVGGNVTVTGETTFANTITVQDSAYITGNLDIGGNVQIDGTLTVDGVVNMKAGSSGTVTLGDDDTDNVVFDADINSNIIPNTNDAFDLGSSSKEWRHAYINGTANIDNVAADSATIGTLKVTDLTENRVVIAGASGEVEDDGNLTFDNNTLAIGSTSIRTGAVGINTTGLEADSATITNDLAIGGDVTSTGTAFTIAAEIGTDDNVSLGDTITFEAGEGITTTVSDNNIKIEGELATSSNKGVASFSTDNFLVSAGVVTIKNNGVALGTETTGNYMSGISGTANEITVSHTPGEGSSATISLPDDVTIGQDLGVTRNLNVTGTFSVGGVTTFTGGTRFATSHNVMLDGVAVNNVNRAGIAIDRPSTDSAVLQWNELGDYWEAGTTDGVNRLALQNDSAVFENVYVAGTLDVNDSVVLNKTTDATSSTSGGSLTASGGAAIAKKLYIGDNLYVPDTKVIGTTKIDNDLVGGGYLRLHADSGVNGSPGMQFVAGSVFASAAPIGFITYGGEFNVTGASLLQLGNASQNLTIDPEGSGNKTLLYAKQAPDGENNTHIAFANTDRIDVKAGMFNITSDSAYFSGDVDISGDVNISGDLIISGTTTTINTETLTLQDNIIVLNSNSAATPSEDAGLEVERGNSTNVVLKWNEGDDRWQFTNNGTTYYNIPISTEYNNYSLPLATDTVRGGIELFSNTDQSTAAESVTTTAGRTYGIQLNSANQAVVNVPWVDTNTDTWVANSSSSAGYVASGSGQNSKVWKTNASGEPAWRDDTDTDTWVANSSSAAGYVASGSGQASKVWKTDGSGNPAWRDDTDTIYSLPLSTSSIRGGMKIGYTENGNNYPVELASEKAYVNVPWTNTTYSAKADGGLELSGTAFNIDSSDLAKYFINNKISGLTPNVSTIYTDGIVTFENENTNTNADKPITLEILNNDTVTASSQTIGHVKFIAENSSSALTEFAAVTGRKEGDQGALDFSVYTSTLKTMATLDSEGLEVFGKTGGAIKIQADSDGSAVIRSSYLRDLEIQAGELQGGNGYNNAVLGLRGASVVAKANREIVLMPGYVGTLGETTANSYVEVRGGNSWSDDAFLVHGTQGSKGSGYGDDGGGAMRFIPGESFDKRCYMLASDDFIIGHSDDFNGSGHNLIFASNNFYFRGMANSPSDDEGRSTGSILLSLNDASYPGAGASEVAQWNYSGDVLNTVDGNFVIEAALPSDNQTMYTDPESTFADGTAVLELMNDTNNPVDNTIIGEVRFTAENTANTISAYASIVGRTVDVTTATMDGKLEFYTTKAGTVTLAMTLDNAGDLTVAGDVTSSSDIRTKENIETVENSLDLVSQLRGVWYNKIGEDDRKVGVIAQEVEEVLPEVVKTDTEGMKSVDYGKMVGVLIEAIKDLKKEIDELRSN